MKDYKINVLWCNAEVYEDNYDEGEGDYVNQWDMHDIKGVYDSVEDLIKEFAKWGFSTKLENYGFFDGNGGEIVSDFLCDDEGMEADKRQIEDWKNGFITLYNARLSCGVELIKSVPMTDKDAKELGLDIY